MNQDNPCHKTKWDDDDDCVPLRWILDEVWGISSSARDAGWWAEFLEIARWGTRMVVGGYQVYLVSHYNVHTGIRIRFCSSPGGFWNCMVYIPCVQTGSRLAGKVPLGRTFPGNPIMWTLAGTSRRWPHRPCWVRGRNSDLGLVIDIAPAVVIKCAHAWNVLARWPNAKLRAHSKNHSTVIVPGRRGAFDDSLDGRS